MLPFATGALKHDLSYHLLPTALSLPPHPTIHRPKTQRRLLQTNHRSSTYIVPEFQGLQVVANIRCRWRGEGHGHRDLVAWSRALFCANGRGVMARTVAIHADLGGNCRGERAVKEEPGAAKATRYNTKTVTQEDTELPKNAFHFQHTANSDPGDYPAYQTIDCRVHQF